MMSEKEIATRVEVADLMARYQRLADSGRLDDLAALFTEDGVFENNTARHVGRAEVLQFFRDTADAWKGSSALPARHHLSSVFIESVDGSSASTYACFQWVGSSGPDHWGTYRDKVVLEDGRWRFSERKAFVEGHVPNSPVIALLGLGLDRTAGSQ